MRICTVQDCTALHVARLREAVEAVAKAIDRTVVEDVMDRAQDMSGCGKPDECRAVAVFLAWLSWNLDHELLPEELR